MYILVEKTKELMMSQNILTRKCFYDMKIYEINVDHDDVETTFTT